MSASTDQRARGVNAAGYFRTESGVGAAARGYVRALQALDTGLALRDLSHLTGNRSEDRTLVRFDGEMPYDINLVCVDLDPHFAVVSELGRGFFEGHYNVGVWAWELLRFPEKWYDRFAYYDEIWVGTSFVANALAPISPIPVVRIPPALAQTTPGSRQAGRARMQAAPHEFVFLFVFDVHSHLERKNPQAVLEAFRCAFSPREPVRLVLKCVNAAAAPDGFSRLVERSHGHNVTICDGYWPAGHMRDLMAGCDAYVSLHRSEGTGLTISDAMSLGKPVIATGWSGNMDFLSVANGFPVQYELVEIGETVGPYCAGETWAEPSIDDAAALMRRVFEDRLEARRRGEVARSDVHRDYSPERISRLIADRLEAIDISRNLPGFRSRMWSRFHEYSVLGDEIRKIADACLPRDATVLVVSRGDEQLLQLDARRAWHFPRTAAGVYAGSHPADSADAISHLNALREQGADFLLVPSTAWWWFDYYDEFARYLERSAKQVVHHYSCVIYSLGTDSDT